MDYIKPITRLFTVITLVLLAIAFLIALAMHNHHSRNWMLRSIVHLSAQVAGYELKIDDFDSKSIGHWSIAHLDVSKSNNPLLKAENIAFEFDVGQLFNKHLQINKLHFNTLDTYIKQNSNGNKTTTLPEFFPVTIQSLDIARLAIHSQYTQFNNEYSVNGKLLFLKDNTPLFVDLSVKTLNGATLSADINTIISNDGSAAITGNVREDKGGALGSLIKLKKTEPLNLTFDVAVQNNEDIFTLTINTLNISYHEHPIAADGKLAIDPSQKKLDITSLTIRIDDHIQKISGTVWQDKLDIKTSLNKVPVLIIQPWVNLGEVKGEFSSDIDISGTLSEPSLQGDLNFNGNYYNTVITLTSSINGDRNKFSISDLKLTTDQKGALHLKGSYDRGVLDFNIEASALPSQIISAAGWHAKPGKFTTNLNIKGTTKAPMINGKLLFSSELSQRFQQIPLSISADISTSESTVNINTLFHQKAKELGYVKFSLPVETYKNISTLSSDIPLKGSLSTDFDLAYLQTLLDPEIHNIRGILKANVALQGRLSSPIIKGNITLQDGHYENSKSGTVLHNINAHTKAENTRITIINATAGDGGSGKLFLSGIADWSNTLQTPVNFELKAEQAKVLRRNDMEGIASGALALTGSFKELLLSGSLNVTPFTLTLDRLLTRNIPEIKVTEEYGNDLEANTSQPDLLRLIPVVNMDVILLADNQAYMRGAGLDTELKGKVFVKGTLNNSRYSGSFKTVRGSYEILGKKFILQDGSVRFEGETISLLVPGVYKNDTTEIHAKLSGTLEDLNLSLSSVPSMPQDEIVSSLLFGKSSKSISPLQAIRLANEVRKLKGGGRELFNPVETARQLIGVDTISVDSEQTENGQDVTVGVGKYVNEKVYIEVEKGSNPAQPLKGKVEAEILPNLNVESSTGGNSGLGGIGLQWKHDY